MAEDYVRNVATCLDYLMPRTTSHQLFSLWQLLSVSFLPISQFTPLGKPDPNPSSNPRLRFMQWYALSSRLKAAEGESSSHLILAFISDEGRAEGDEKQSKPEQYSVCGRYTHIWLLKTAALGIIFQLPVPFLPWKVIIYLMISLNTSNVVSYF